MLLSRKAMEVEQEILKLKNYAMKTEEEKIHLERKSREAETLTARLGKKLKEFHFVFNKLWIIYTVEDSQKRAAEAERLKNELINARVAEKEAKEKLLTFLSSATISSPSPMPVPTVQLLTSDRYMSVSTHSLIESNAYDDQVEINSYELVENGDLNELSLEIEKERTEYLAKSKQVQSQLKDLRSEIEMLKISESEFDRINTEQLKLGENKYSTLKKALKQKFFFL